MYLNLLKITVCAGLLAVFVTACSREQAPAEPEPAAAPASPVSPETSIGQNAVSESVTAEFRTFLAENYAVDMAREPLTASYRGIKTNQDQWNSYSESHLQETREINEARLQQLAEFDRDALAPSDRLSWDLYKLDLERQLARDEFRHHLFVIQQFRGPHTMAPSSLINIHQVKDVADAEAYIGRLNNIENWFDEVIEQLEIRSEKNLLLADWQYPPMIEASRNVISGVPFTEEGGNSTLWEDFQAKVAALDIEQDSREQLLDEARRALVDVVQPAYEKLIAALEKQAENAPEADGVWKFTNGDAFYAERLRWFTTTDLTAEEVHQLGLQEVDRIHGLMREIMAQVEFEGELQEFFEFMRSDPQFYYPNTDAGREAYLTDARAAIDAIRPLLSEQFGLLPEAELVVKRVEAFREKSAGKAFYQGPPPDGSRPGIYYANLYDMTSMPTYQLEALAYHEGLPGHHMQRAISVELKGLPEFQRYASFTAYSEGWGLYSEELAKDMGMYEDPYSDFGRLALELWRACRLVVDTGLHNKRWTREEAIAYLLENTPNSETDSTKAIERYIAMPGQATAYLVGKLKIMELRERAREELGEQFDIRAFHDEVLKHGPVPMSLLEQNVERLIADTLAAKAD
ncbi:DUF885 domain-containing protein [Kineobactrum salinum]|uniref:DUF885 domain-containing protein n=1 Tax=Kineobactrum salinum TaxID=2708301 RepID=A0A6C0TZN3_9GAMM|nr:DUF885 domain-containing protein [Kineobactrum salinum]QIB64819.1 DUF885 domain-containing protein [Kineobactrum salinum]